MQPSNFEFFVPHDQGDNQAFAPSASCSPGAMQVGLVVRWRIVVDDDCNVVDVDSTGGDIGGDKNLQLAVREVAKRLLPVLLAQVSMDRCSLDALLRELAGQPVGHVLGRGEHNRTVDAFSDGCGDLDLSI